MVSLAIVGYNFVSNPVIFEGIYIILHQMLHSMSHGRSVLVTRVNNPSIKVTNKELCTLFKTYQGGHNS